MGVSFKNQTVVVVRPDWVVERGNRIPDWSNATEFPVSGCRVQPMTGDEVMFSGASDEGGTNRDSVITRWKLFGPPGMDIEAYDRVRHLGKTYEVEGPPQEWPSPTGVLRHTEARLMLVEG